MKPGDTRICPSCQARNKAKWEFCVRCGESLQGVPLGAPDEAAESPKAAVEEVAEPHPEAEFKFWLVTIGGLVALTLAGLVAWNWLRPAPAPASPGADAGIFTMPSLPPQRPPGEPAEKRPGVDHLLAGRKLLDQGDFAGALAELAAALEQAPDDPTAHNLYGHALLKAGRPSDGLAQFRAAVQLSPDDVGLRVDLGRALAGNGSPSEAAEQYQQCLRVKPQSTVCLRELSTLSSAQGDWKRAAELLGQA